MKQACAGDIYAWIDSVAPFETAMDFDNCGLLLGRMDAPVTRVLVTLDATPRVLEEAVSLGAEMILSHHPLMFHAIRNVREDAYEGALIASLIRRNMCLLAAHTNLDQSDLSGSAAVAHRLGLQNLRRDGFVFMGELPGGGESAGMLQKRISAAIDEYTYLYGSKDTVITTLGICGGAYDDGYTKALAAGAQGYLTGEVHHHNALAAVGEGFPLFSGGHFGTEAPLVPVVAKALQNAMNALKYNVAVYASAVKPYGAPANA